MSDDAILTIEDIEKEQDTDVRVSLYDQRYKAHFEKKKRKRRRKHAGATKRKRKRKQKKEKCMWPECNNDAVSLHMCVSCRTKHYNGKILTADPRFFNHEETIELYEDVIAFMEKEEVTREQAITWLIAEGLNRIDEKEKKND